MSASKPPERVIKDIHQVLRNLGGETARRRSRLARSGWLQLSCLVRTRIQQHPSEQYRHTLKAVITTALETMEKDAPLYADLLRLRFWERLTVKQIVSISKESLNREPSTFAHSTNPREFMRRFSSERQVYSLQQEAIKLLALTVWELEVLCNKAATKGDTEIDPGNVSSKEHFSQSSPTSDNRLSHLLKPRVAQAVGDYGNLAYLSSQPPHLRKLGAVRELQPDQRPTRSELLTIIAYELGYRVRQQAEIFNRSEKTIRTLLQRAHEKVYADNVTEAIWLIEQSDWFDDLRGEIERDIVEHVQRWEATRHR